MNHKLTFVMKKIIFLIVTTILFSCNKKEPITKASLGFSEQEKVDAKNIKHFFDTALTRSQLETIK